MLPSVVLCSSVLDSLLSNSGTNSCAFLALKVAEAWYRKMKGGIVELSCFTRTVEDILNRFSRNVNPFRDVYRCYDVIEASEILKENSLICTPTLKELTEVTQIFTTEGRNDLLSALREIEDIGIMVCPPYICTIGRLPGEYFVIDTHAIDNRIGGNGNGIVIQFPNVLSCLCWIIKRFHSSCVKASTFQSLYEVSFPIMDEFLSESSDDTMLQSYSSPLKSNGKRESEEVDKELKKSRKTEAKVGEENITEEEKDEDEIDKETQITQDANITTSNTFNSTKKDELLNPLDWESVELKYWGQHNLPYLDDVKRKLSNSESLALINSSTDTCLRIPRACRRNAIFVINSDHIKNRNDIKSDLNGIFKKCLESKCKTVELSDFSVKIISPKKRKLNEN